ncbi:MAG TPA: tripartite tricarboxylate transporter substrate-binding protein [Ramlibacter sp.]|jgi:tripartite-type tricarboxylate transporter receptor subunit TctC|nr:tripartite tricarboxylate transporter substrate-binding protein [Ramlibacter sp.]
MHDRRTFLLASAAYALIAVVLSARPPAFPSRPLVLVVPSAAGSGIDPVARALARRLAAALGQPVRVENLPGGGGDIAASVVSGERPDGHTFLVTLDAIASARGVEYLEVGRCCWIAAPAGTPRHALERLHREVEVALSAPELREQFAQLRRN